MSRNGSGIYSLPPGSMIANGDTSDATDLNVPLADIEADLNVARPIVAGGTGATSASAARTALGLVVGTNVQAFNANLSSLAGLTLAANKGLYSTGADTVELYDLTAAGLALLDDADAAAQRTTLGLGSAAVREAEDTLTDGDNLPDGAAVTAFVAAQIAAAGSTVSAEQATTSGTAFDFSDIPDGAARVEILFDHVGTNGTDDLLVQIGPAAGVEISDYNASSGRMTGGGRTVNEDTTGFNITRTGAGDHISGEMTLVKGPANRWHQGHGGTIDFGTGGIVSGGGSKSIAGALKNLRLTRVGTNTFDSGSVSIRVSK